MVAAIAFESIVKLVAFLAVGLFVTFGLFGGFGEIFAQAAACRSAGAAVIDRRRRGQYATWIALTLLAMAAIMFLPRQFQVLVVENVDEGHLQQGDLAVPALSAAHQHLRAADRVRRAPACSRTAASTRTRSC